MKAGFLHPVLSNREPLMPIESLIEARLRRLKSIRAVIFDVYGTLVISGTGDIGPSEAEVNSAHTLKADQIAITAEEAMSQCGVSLAGMTGDQFVQLLHETVRESNLVLSDQGVEKPEVNILDIWRKTLHRAELGHVANHTHTVLKLAAHYEARANPTWPMPGAESLLNALQQAKLQLGIVSNAQVFTIPIIEDLVKGQLFTKGFNADLCVFSNRFRRAKPDPRLFNCLVASLERKNISPHQTLYVGNDMLNDVFAASTAGLRTAWFAGDRRSARRRSGDSRCESLEADLVLTDLMQLPECLQLG